MADDEPRGPDDRDDADAADQNESVDYFNDAASPAAARRGGEAAVAERTAASEQPRDAGRDRSLRLPGLLTPSRWRRLRREVVGVLVVGVLVAICGALALVVAQKSRVQETAAEQAAATYTPPALPSTAPGLLTVVIGDGSLTTTAPGLTSEERWPSLLAADLRGQVTTIASPNAGYTHKGSNGQTFVQAVGKVPQDADIVVFVGGAGDASTTTAALGRAATQAFSDAADRVPHATLIAVGPLFQPTGATSTELDAVRTVLQSTARANGVDWVDPIRGQWLKGVKTASDLDAADERQIASRVQRAVEATGD